MAGDPAPARARFPGFLVQHIQAPIDGVNDERISIIAFEGEDQLRAWMHAKNAKLCSPKATRRWSGSTFVLPKAHSRVGSSLLDAIVVVAPFGASVESFWVISGVLDT